MEASAPKRSRVGRQASSVMKPNPKALKAGMAPIRSEAMTPAKIRTTASAAPSASQRKRVSPAPARRASAVRSDRSARCDGFSLQLISVKDDPGGLEQAKFTPAPRHEHHSPAKLL